MALSFDATYYISQRPDVFQAYVASAGKTGLSLAQFAELHYNQNGRFEGANPNAIFNTNEYLAANPDVAKAGVNPFTHYLQNGAAEDRAPSASFPSFASFDSAAYLAANPDLAAAGITTAAKAYTHFVIFGQFESRPGTPTIVAAAGVTIPLTTAIEVKNGTTGNDLFTAVVSSTAGEATLQSGDSVVGKGGIDKLTATLVNANAVTVAADLTNISVFEARNFSGSSATFQLGSAIGLKEIDTSGTGAQVVVNGLKNIVDVKLADTGAQGLNITYDGVATAGAADIQNVAVTSGNSTLQVSNIETVNVTSTGAVSGAETNTLTLFDAGLTNLNILGAGNINISNGLDATTTTVDASKATGNVTVNLSANAADVKVTGGTGADTFNFGGTLTKADVVNGGAGIDTVVVTGADYSASGNAVLGGLNALTSIEVLKFTGNAAATIINGNTFANTGVTTLLFDTAGQTDTVQNIGAGLKFAFDSGNTTVAGNVVNNAATIGLNSGITTADITLQGDTGLVGVTKDGALAASVGNLTVNLAVGTASTVTETIALHSTGDLKTTDVFNTVGTITLAAGSKIVIDGTSSLSIAGLTNSGVVDASALTAGKLDFHGSAFTGVAGSAGVAPTAPTNSGVDTLTLAANKLTDTVHFTEGGTFDSGTIVFAGAGALAATTGAILHDVIVNFTAGAGGDVLDISTGNTVIGYTALSSAAQVTVDATTSLLAAANAAAAAHTGTDWTAFNFGGATYAYHEQANTAAFANGDTIVELTGVAGGAASLTSANFA